MKPENDLVIERAVLEDVPGIVAVLADDTVGGADDYWSESRREAYERGFAAVSASPDNELYVAKRAGKVIGVIQVTFVPHVGRLGALRCIFESVFVAASERGRGIGGALLKVAEGRAKARGASFITLSSNKKRVDAHRFYETRGYAKSHEGFKKTLEQKNA